MHFVGKTNELFTVHLLELAYIALIFAERFNNTNSFKILVSKIEKDKLLLKKRKTFIQVTSLCRHDCI